MFICQFYFPSICFSPVCKPRNGERKCDANTFFLQLPQSLSFCPPGCRWSAIHTVTKPACPHGNKIINQQAGSTESFLQPKNPRTRSSLDCTEDKRASESLQHSFYFITTLFSCPFENCYINPQILDIELSRCSKFNYSSLLITVLAESASHPVLASSHSLHVFNDGVYFGKSFMTFDDGSP